MYKKLLYFLVAFWVFGIATNAQEQSDHKGAVLTGGLVFKSTDEKLQLQFQIGNSFLYDLDINQHFKVDFPFGINYVPNTFSENTFEVSKGYYEEYIKINWSIGANEQTINKFQVFRKRLNSQEPYQLLATLGANVFEYLDTQIEGGVLYQYKVSALGITNIEQLFVTYIEGIGYRSPTAFVSGSVTFEGGSPVKDVIVFAEPIGAEATSVGTSMHFSDYNEHIRLSSGFTNVSAQRLTIQGWFAPSVNQQNQKLFYFTDSNNTVYSLYFYYAPDGAGKKIIANVTQGSTVIYSFELKNSYPTGNINARGDDVFANIADITDSTFVHVSLVLENNTQPKIYINGRAINKTYIDGIKTVDSGVTLPNFINAVSTNFSNTSNLNLLGIGAEYIGYVDEFRLWKRILTDAEIRRDYKRYLDGGESGLSMYNRMDEGFGNYAYDLSKTGFNFHKKDLLKSIVDSDKTKFSNVVPTKEQLGIFGVTDADGSYAISAIPYAGSGEQFKITPSFGVHKFKPASQTLFLGKEESVVNQLNFEDVSSFKFNGRIVYDTRNVFNNLPITDPALQNITEIREVGYNQYLVNNTTIINKGQYYYEGGTVTNGNLTGGTLKRYPVLGLEDANIYIDGNLVFDEDNQPVVTDAEGKFSINVPIGRHKVEVKKEGHVFALEGRFPEKTSNLNSNLFDFYEDQIQDRWFIDQTRVTVVGRVVGGRIESEKEIGFGFDGLKKHTNKVASGDPENIETYSSINNIGKATITLKGNKTSSELDYVFETNPQTGEYSIKLIPYVYHISKNGGISIASNATINGDFLDADDVLDVTEIKEETASRFVSADGTAYISDKYQYVKSFRYNSPVVMKLIAQEYEKEFEVINDNGLATKVDVSQLEIPLYKQRQNYRLVFEITQDYVNKDGSNDVVVKEYFNEGTFNITNNLASTASNSSSVKSYKNGDREQFVYSFLAGLPNITQANGFSDEIKIEYVIEGSNPIGISNLSDFKNKGIVIGARQADGTTFSTVAPEVPDIILRDPPGSNSFASIEKGTVISFESSNTKSNSSTHGGGYYVSVGPTWDVSVGFISVFTNTETNIVADTEGNMSKTQEFTSNGTTVNTYEFSQTISTSDEPDYVGADGDLYIGNAKNIYYGLIDNMFVTSHVPKLTNNAVVPHIIVKGKDKNNNEIDVYISARKDYLIAEQPTNTFFMYSQKHIIERLIPDLQNLANVAPETISQNSPIGTQTKNFYLKQIDLWKKVIQDNERDKYLALNSRNTLRAEALGIVNQRNNEKNARRAQLEDLPYGLRDGYNLGELDTYVTGLSTLLTNNFESNRSFDSGVGEFTSSITTSTVVSKSFEKTIDLTDEFKTQLGLLVNNVGAVANTASAHSSVNSASENSSKELTTTISYTLKDNDPENVLSVDVVNLFDGFGPIFITKGGTTSCPFEGPTISNYYKHSTYNPNNITVGTGGETLSISTISVFKPELKVDKNLITNLPESEGALFTLKLKNLSNTGTNLEHRLYVDQTTLKGAISNIDQNGINVLLPYNETVEIPIIITKNSASDVYNYENIRVYLANPCDGINESEAFVDINVEFKKSCSRVVVSAPQDNWVFNRNEAFSTDANGMVSNNSLPITFTDFNTDFSGFRKIELQYRNSNASSWTKFKSYYGSEQLKRDAGDDNGIVITSQNEFTFNWDIVGTNIPDGNYQIRAVAFCTDNVTYESKIINGVINLTAPVLFGNPKPSDGILDIGEVISVRFNETVNKGIATNITLRGLQNQQAIDHSVAVSLDGTNNQIELPAQNLQSKSFTIQFWLDSKTTGNGVLLQQKDGPKISLNGDNLTFEINGVSTSTIIDNTQYNFYSFVYKSGNSPLLEILQNGNVLKTEMLSKELSFNTNNAIFIGGSNILGTIHDIRIWSKATTPGLAAAEKDLTLKGNEINLLGYWPLNEGNGTIGIDLVRRRNAKVNLSWTIKPKGQGYEFSNNSFLSLNNVGFVQPTNFEDITLSFWLKANSGDKGTIFSNGLGTNNADEPLLTNGFRNKWSLDLDATGNIILLTENKSFKVTSTSITDGNWHHIALRVKRGANLIGIIDGKQVTSVSAQGIGGIAGSKIILGAKLNQPLLGNATYSNYLTAKVDEFRLWNTSRSFEQIKRDQYFEIDRETPGLLLYVNFNLEEGVNSSTNPPRYFVRKGDGVVQSFLSDLNGAERKFIEDSPSIKPALKYINIPFSTVINNDEMIISPDLTLEEWSLFEGQILDVSVSEMYDIHFNKQLSPISFSAFVNKQEMEWYTQDGAKEIVDEKIVNETYSFTMDIVNKGGSNQNFSISGLPSWMKVSASSGVVSPTTTKKITFTIDKELAMGTYNTDVYLQLSNGYSDRLSFNLRVLQQAPNWAVNPSNFSYSMNIINQIKLDNVLSRDKYTKVGAFVNGVPRGEAYLVYDQNYDAYFAFLTIYSNESATENVTFKIWDALNGKIRIASINDAQNITFLQNEVIGKKSAPAIFSASNYLEQNVSLNKGWTWTSFYVQDNRFVNFDNLFAGLDLTDGDIIKSATKFTRYENGFWSGSLTEVKNDESYQIQLGKANQLKLNGSVVEENQININIANGWNWLSYPIHRNISLEEALAFFDPTDGDLIKDQYQFAIYDGNANEWTGTLLYLQPNRGYLLKADKAQVLNYPNLDFSLSKSISGQEHTQSMIDNFSKYQYNMSVIAEVVNTTAFTKVLVYDQKGILRGEGEIKNINQKQLCFITVFGDVDETLYYVLANEKSQYQESTLLAFAANKIEGSLVNPIQLGSKSLSNNTIVFEGLSLYPNPFDNELHINIANTNITKAVLFDVIGKAVMNISIKNKVTKVSTQNLAQGIYTLRVSDEKGNFMVRKLIKK